MFLIDIVLILFFILIREKRKKNKTKHFGRKVVFLGLVLIPLKFALYFSLLFGKLPTVYSENGSYLSQNELAFHYFASRGLSLLYPVWGPYLYGLTWYRGSFDKGFSGRSEVESLKKDCLGSDWTNGEKCSTYMRTISTREDYFSEFLESLSEFTRKLPSEACSSIEIMQRGIWEVTKNRVAKSESRQIDIEKLFGVRVGIYESKTHKVLDKLISKGCVAAYRSKYLALDLRDYFYYKYKVKNESTDFFQLVCQKDKIFCEEQWANNYEISFTKNRRHIVELHKRLCTKNTTLKFCKE
jgi:hypothetical protein